MIHVDKTKLRAFHPDYAAALAGYCDERLGRKAKPYAKRQKAYLAGRADARRNK